jgi:hypothetical protein
MKLRIVLTALIVALTGLAVPGIAVASPIDASVHHPSAARHACTRHANGRCVKRGQRCTTAMRGRTAYDNQGRRNVCRGKGRHPHWRKPVAHMCRVTGSSAATAGCVIIPECTKNAAGSCIQTGDSCAPEQYGETGYDDQMMFVMCEGDQADPHWGAPPAPQA